MGKIAFVFAGQGAQYTGMGRELYESSPDARRVYELCDAVRPGTSALCFTGDKAALAVTENTQPAMFATDLACAEALRGRGVVPAMAAGFSLGEVAAAAFTGMLDTESAFRLVVRRGQLMQACAEAHSGSMAPFCGCRTKRWRRSARPFARLPVNYNCAGQLTVAGDSAEMPAFIKAVTESSGRAVPLAVSGAFHSPFMTEASDGLAAYLASVELREPALPLYANLTARPYAGDLRATLAAQVKSPVRWEKPCGIWLMQAPTSSARSGRARCCRA
ncbi:MAG: ACP S-malonyltransferase [Acutalibacteraceae bacterium]